MARDPDRAFFGHPRGLANLFFTEMWERFSYYGMRAFLIYYLLAPETLGGRGLTAGTAGSVFAVFASSVYFLALPGGWIADRFLGQRKGVIVGGIGIAAGNALLAIPGLGNVFYLGLLLIAIGTGFLKPNISTLVGQLYKEDDPRRDSGYTIYYMGINIGAFIAPLVCGFLAQSDTFRAWVIERGMDPNLVWNFAFGAAAIGMVLGLFQFISFKHWLGDAGAQPTIPEEPARAQRDRHVLIAIGLALLGIGGLVVATTPSEDTIANFQGIGLSIGSIVMFVGLYKLARDPKERRGILAMIPLFLGAVAFFAIFEQAPTTLSIFAKDFTEPDFLGFFEPSYYQSINAIFIVALAPVFAIMWVALARRRKEPSSVSKFAIGMLLLALSFVVMVPTFGATEGTRFSGFYLTGLYLFNTLAELCISPVGLSSMSKLAPRRLAGMVMGMWFFGTAVGIYLAGRATSISSGRGFDFLFIFLFISSLVVAGALFLVAPKIRRMMAANEHAKGPADKSEKAEPEPLPSARIVKDNTKVGED
ncbi:MAG: peptide MFS transporter [Deltaproteobacteria bacterium]|nr:peptide MFS transporter [Deltaproteobacteria bacterium]MDQ3298676.1 peptide MFS transporter [Myxococcota bacterium]